VALPLPLRNRLADLILDALHDPSARRGLEALAAVCAHPRALDQADLPRAFPTELFDRRPDGWRIKPGFRDHRTALGERAARAVRALASRPFSAADPPLEVALSQAGVLFGAGLYFEVHEMLEPHWMRTDGAERRALQGLIQVAVGFQHLVNDNPDGARALLGEGVAKLVGRRLAGRELDDFARRVDRCRRDVVDLGAEAAARFDWSTVPPFPAER
jgi:Domain of unknown function (DUF309)